MKMMIVMMVVVVVVVLDWMNVGHAKVGQLEKVAMAVVTFDDAVIFDA